MKLTCSLLALLLATSLHGGVASAEEPGNQPVAEPGSQPAEPGSQPAEPGPQPVAEPGSQPAEPGTQPVAEPGSQPAEPGSQPDDVAASAAAKTLSLDQAISFALSRHPRLAAARNETTASEARVGVARSRYYPQINVWLQYVRATENGNPASFFSAPGFSRIGGSRREGLSAYDSFNNYHAAVTVHQLLHDFGRTQGRVAAQKAMVESAKMNERLVEQAVIFGVTRAYYEVLAGQEAVRVAEEALTRSQRLLDLAKAGQDAGLRQPSEKARAEADVASAEVRKIEALAALDVARAQFVNSLGLPEASFEPAGAEPTPQLHVADNDALTLALQNRPELKALELERTVLNERMRATRAEHYPRIEAVGAVQSRGQFLGGEQYDFTSLNWSAGVVAQIPIFQGGLVTEQTKAIQAEIHAIESGREAIRQAVILEVKQALAQVRSADEAERAALTAVEAAKVALDTSEGRYRTGLATLVEMTDAQGAYISAMSSAVRASYNRRFARAALSLAMGTLGASEAPRND